MSLASAEFLQLQHVCVLLELHTHKTNKQTNKLAAVWPYLSTVATIYSQALAALLVTVCLSYYTCDHWTESKTALLSRGGDLKAFLKPFET